MPRVKGPNSLWRMDTTSHAAHSRCRTMWGKPSQYPCVECRRPASDWAYDGTDPTHIYTEDKRGRWMIHSRFPEFYMPMCRGCHRRHDIRSVFEELHAYRLASMRTVGSCGTRRILTPA